MAAVFVVLDWRNLWPLPAGLFKGVILTLVLENGTSIHSCSLSLSDAGGGGT